MTAAPPTYYSDKLAAKICDRLAEGLSLNQLCKADGMPNRKTVMRWFRDNEEFADAFKKARIAGYELLAEGLLEIADDGSEDWKTIVKDGEEIKVFDKEHVQRSKLRVETRKWILAKMLPKVYGDRTAIEHSGSIGDGLEDLTDEQLERRKKILESQMAALAAKV